MEVVEELAERWEATEGDLTDTLASLCIDERDGISRNCCSPPGDPFDDGPETDAEEAMTRWRASPDEDDQTPPFPAADAVPELALLTRLMLAERSTGGYAAAEFHPIPLMSANVSVSERKEGPHLVRHRRRQTKVACAYSLDQVEEVRACSGSTQLAFLVALPCSRHSSSEHG